MFQILEHNFQELHIRQHTSVKSHADDMSNEINVKKFRANSIASPKCYHPTVQARFVRSMHRSTSYTATTNSTAFTSLLSVFIYECFACCLVHCAASQNGWPWATVVFSVRGLQLKKLVRKLSRRSWLEGNFAKGKVPDSVAVPLHRALIFCFIAIIIHDHDTWYWFLFGDKTVFAVPK